MDNLFPVDIFAVKQYGIERWQRDFFWPVSDKEFVALSEDIENCMRRHVENQPREIADALFVHRGLMFEYEHFLHALKVLDEVRKRGMKPLYSDHALWYKDLISGTLEKRISEFSNVFSDVKRRSELSQKLKIAIKQLIKNLYYNASFSKLWSLVRDKEMTRIYGVPHFFVAKCMGAMSQYVSIVYPNNDYCSKGSICDLSYSLKQKLADFAKEIAEDMRFIGGQYDIPLKDEHVDYLRQFNEQRLVDAATLLSSARASVSSKSKFHFLAQHIQTPSERAMAIAVREAGGKVTSFTHGGHIGFLNSSTVSYSEFALSDIFIAYTRKSAELFEIIKRERSIVHNNVVRIEWSDGTMYRDMWKRWRHVSIPQQIKKVMLVGYPLNQWRKPQGSASLALMQLDFELRIIDVLKQAGYDVLYKAHPDRLREVEGIFEEKTTVLIKQFEKVMGQADIFLFPNIRTTAFNIALCTNKPVIGFIGHDEYPPPFPEPMELLKKRCHLLYTYFDDRNRIMFQGNDLLRALTKIPQMPNMEFMNTYLFP